MCIDKLKVVLCDQRGQGLVEYSLVLTLVSLIVIAALKQIGLFPPDMFSGALRALQ